MRYLYRAFVAWLTSDTEHDSAYLAGIARGQAW
jgi:hypothetical protein